MWYVFPVCEKAHIKDPLLSNILELQRRAGYSSVVDRLLMVRGVLGSIPYSGSFELYLVPTRSPQLVCTILSVKWFV